MLWHELLLQFSKQWLQTLYICSAWNEDVLDIFPCGSLHYFLQGSTISQNLLMWTTSTVLKIFTWNFKHMFDIKCTFAWHIFHADHSIIIGRGAWLTISSVNFVINLAFSTLTKQILTSPFFCLKIQSFPNISFTGCSVITFD